MATPRLSGVRAAPRRRAPGPAHWRDQAGWQTAAAALLLALACAALQGAALSGGWHFDDGPHLNFVTQYAPWQYFFVPEVMLQQSYAHITPWNALFYDMGLPFFGLQPRGHYAHLLAVLWLAALATFVLLRHWLAWAPALAGAVLFLAMPATGAVARLLMTGHYAYGVLFSVLALLAFARAARQGSLAWGLLAALAYALACLCKELYVPLVAVLLCWPEGSVRARLRIAAPVLGVALAYGVWRLWLLHGAGGYAEALHPPAVSWQQQVWLSLLQLRERAVGPGWTGWLALGCAFALVAWGWMERGAAAPGGPAAGAARLQRWRLALFAGAWATVLALPLGRMLLQTLEITSGRLLVFAGWAAAAALAFALPGAWRRSPAATGLLLAGLLGGLAVGELRIGREIALSQDVMVQQNRLLASGEPGALVAHHYEATGYLRAMARAAARLQGGPERALVEDEEALAALGPQAGAAAWMYAFDCRCMRRLGADYAPLVADFTDRLVRGRKHSAELAAHVSFEGPRQRKVLRWTIDGAPFPAWERHFYVRDFGRALVPVQGSYAFGLDATAPFEESFRFRLSFTLPDGALVRSPLLSLPLDRPGQVQWSGADPVAAAVPAP